MRKSKKSLPRSYAALRSQVSSEITSGKRREAGEAEQEKVNTSWQAGSLILQHILLNKKRAGYDEKVIQRLAKDLHLSRSELSSMLEFARAYKKCPVPGVLSWSHYRELLLMENEGQRKALTQQAARGKWSHEVLRSQIQLIVNLNRTPCFTSVIR